jgi:Domain of unknown function (DUF4372)/Transposase DDE domain
MNTGRTLFAQLMDFLPWSSFDRIVARYGGNRAVRKLSCAAQYQIMAFAQLTYRESLRDIEACLSAQASKLYHMGLREPVRRSTLADANESRDWRIYAEFAQRLIAQARCLYASESLGAELTNSVYALDSTTIDLCMSVFPWAHFRSTKSAVKMHTLLDLRGNIPSFIHISNGKLHDVHALDMLIPEPGAVYVMDRGYIDFARLHTLHQAGAFFVTRAKSNLHAHRIYSAPTDRATGVLADQTHRIGRPSYPSGLSGASAAHPLPRRRNGQDTGLPDQSDRVASIDHLRSVPKPLAGGALFQADKTASADQAVLRHFGKRREDANLDRRFGLSADGDRAQTAQPGGAALHIAAGLFGDGIRKNRDPDCVLSRGRQIQKLARREPTEFIRILTGQ